MSDKTGIEWTDATWNPATGCNEVSPGCDHCYAKTFAERWRGTPGHYFEQGFDVTLRPDKLALPLTWRKPRKVFVNSMSDLFHKDVPDDYIAKVFAVMALAPQHTFQVLTKRHARMRSLLSSQAWPDLVDVALRELMMAGRITQEACASAPLLQEGPLPNVWLGVSVEDQHWADIRVPALLDTPAAVRFLSCEPLLGPVDLARWTRPHADYCQDENGEPPWCGCGRDLDGYLDWVIVGGESGPGARSMDPEWARSLRDQCTAAGVPFLFKQWGGRTPKAGGRELDGRTWDQYPPAPVPA